MRRLYVHEQPGWPHLRWDSVRVADHLVAVRYGQGRLVGRMRALGFDLQQEAILETLTQDVHKTSDIEGNGSTLGRSVHRSLVVSGSKRAVYLMWISGLRVLWR